MTVIKTAATVIHDDVLSYRADGRRYDLYVSLAENFSLDTVSEHVAAFMADYDKTNKYDADNATDAEKYDRKKYQMRVRENLKRRAGFVKAESGKSDKYVTAEGLKAESWEAFVAKARAEWDAANSK